MSYCVLMLLLYQDDFLVPNFSLGYETHSFLCEIHVSGMKKMIVIHSNKLVTKL